MNILITGSTGFVGRNFLKSPFFLNHNIIHFDNRQDKNYNKFINVDIIIHFAGLAHDTNMKRNSKDYYLINTEYTKLIFDKFIISNATKFIFLSSIKAITDYSENRINELTEPKPNSDYGKSKLLAERYITEYPTSVNKKTYILRPSLIYGSNIKGNLHSLFKYIKILKFWPFGSLNNKRSYCYIENLFFTINEIIESNEIKPGIYNISDNDPISTTDLIKYFSFYTNCNIFFINIPIKYFETFLMISKKLNINFIINFYNKMFKKNIVDNTFLIKSLNKNLPYTVEEGFKETFKDLNFKNY
jgi:nucleoside-diphosphate-sugar epimerase